MQIRTPTGTPFSFEINQATQSIVIISENNNRHVYSIAALRDLYIWLRTNNNGNWVLLGSRGEEVQAPQGTVEEWARSSSNPNSGFYGLTTGRRGRFASYIPSILEHLGFVEVEHNARNNRVRAII